MTQHKARLTLVDVRLSGHPDDVDEIARRLTETFPSSDPSSPRPDRTGDTVRVYLKVSPE